MATRASPPYPFGGSDASRLSRCLAEHGLDLTIGAAELVRGPPRERVVDAGVKTQEHCLPPSREDTGRASDLDHQYSVP